MTKWIEDEIIDTPETEIIEENIYVDENLIKNKSLVRVDMNVIQYPLFSKNTKRKTNQIIKYYFNSNRDTYITVSPIAGDYIPGEAEEKVFIALMKIMKLKGMARKFIVTSSDLKKELNLNTKAYSTVIRDSLKRLASAKYEFKNTLYSNKNNGILTKETHTSIMDLQVLVLDENENKNLRKEYKDKRIKEVYEIVISDHFYDNIVTKGYLVYDSDILLSFDSSTTRTIYMLIEKLRYNELYLKVDIIFLIKRIPLRWDKRNLSQTIKALEKAFEELKLKDLIDDFKIIKETTWEKSELEIFFPESVVHAKQDRFYGDFNDFRNLSTKMLISGTEHEIIEQEIQELKSKIETLDITSEVVGEVEDVTTDMIREIFELLPSVAKKLKSMPKTIQDSIPKYGFKAVKAAAIYLAKQKNLKSPRAYFLKSLDKKWYEDIVDVIQKPKKAVLEVSDTVFQNDFNSLNDNSEKDLYLENIFNEFQKLDEKVRNGIESYAYREYIARCGAETKIQKLAFLAGRKSIITEFLIKYPRVLSEESVVQLQNLNPKIEETEIVKKNDEIQQPRLFKEIKQIEESIISEKTPLNDIQKLNEFINTAIEVYKVVLNLSDEKILEIKRDILKELIEKFINKTLTLDIIKTIIHTKAK